MPKENIAYDWPCPIELNKKPIARGINSEVYRDGNNVIKVYKAGNNILGVTDYKQLLLYQSVTNEASEFSRTAGWTIQLPLLLRNYRVFVNPLPSLRKCEKCGFSEARVPYIPHARLDSFPAIFFFDITNLMLGYLSDKIGIEMKVKGISISPCNVKRFDSTTVVVTDLCSDIGALRRW